MITTRGLYYDGTGFLNFLRFKPPDEFFYSGKGIGALISLLLRRTETHDQCIFADIDTDTLLYHDMIDKEVRKMVLLQSGEA
jgi:hypothetical protein